MNNFAYSKDFDWYNAGFYNGLTYDSASNGMKIEDTPVAIVSIVTKYTEKAKELMP